jgi:hypothetical protein
MDGVFNFFQRSPIIIGDPMERFEVPGLPSSCEAAGLRSSIIYFTYFKTLFICWINFFMLSISSSWRSLAS